MGRMARIEEAIEQLMDREWPEDKKAASSKSLAATELRGVHDLRTRTSGNRDFVQFHVWVDGSMTVTQAHRVMDEIEDKLHAEFPDVEILIHPDPEGHVDERGVAGRDILQDV
jgi:ferrous-iron efflux pump FieF